MGLPASTKGTSIRRAASSKAALVAFLFACGARAAPSGGDISAARRLFSEATVLREAGQWAEAATKLREAIAIKETPGLRFHLAHCEEQMGRLLAARDDYDRADVLVREGAAASDVAALLEPARSALHERIPTLVVRAPNDARAVGLSIDGDMIASDDLGSPIQLDPGVHTVVVSAAARDPFRLELTLKEGEDRVVQAQLPHRAGPPPRALSSLPPKPAAEQQTAEKRGFGLREAVLIGEGVVTAAGLGLGVAFLVKAASDDDRVSSQSAQLKGQGACIPPTQFESECDSIRQAQNDRRDDAVVGVTGLVIAGVGAASLVTTWLMWPTHRVTHAARIQMIPVVGGGVVRGIF